MNYFKKHVADQAELGYDTYLQLITILGNHIIWFSQFNLENSSYLVNHTATNLKSVKIPL